MKVSSVFTFLLAALLFVAAGTAWAAEKSKPQTLCPVMGGEINKEVFADHEGKRVYFCCPGCIEKFKADPAGYIQKMEAQGITLAKATKPQALCPVMGGEINREVYTDYKGKRVYFCCEMCVAKFKNDPESYLKKQEEEGVELEKTPDLKHSEHSASQG